MLDTEGDQSRMKGWSTSICWRNMKMCANLHTGLSNSGSPHKAENAKETGIRNQFSSIKNKKNCILKIRTISLMTNSAKSEHCLAMVNKFRRIYSKNKREMKAGHTGSTWIACMLSGPEPWTRNNATLSSVYVSSGTSFSAIYFL